MQYKKVNGIYLEMPVEIVRPRGCLGLYLHDAKTGKLKSYDFVKNMFMNAGRVSIARRMRNLTDVDHGIITYMALGTGTTAPLPANTTLVAEVARKLIATRDEAPGATNGIVCTTFFNTSEGNGSLREAALFGDDASATVNSGTMYARTLINREKTTADTLTGEWTVVIG